MEEQYEFAASVRVALSYQAELPECPRENSNIFSYSVEKVEPLMLQHVTHMSTVKPQSSAEWNGETVLFLQFSCAILHGN